MNENKEGKRIPESEHNEIISERDQRIKSLESKLITSTIFAELKTQRIKSPDIMALHLAKFVKLDEGDNPVVVDENGNPQRRAEQITDADGNSKVEWVDLTVSDLLNETLDRDEFQHFRADYQPEVESDEQSISDEEYRQAFDEARKQGHVDGRFLRALRKRYPEKS